MIVLAVVVVLIPAATIVLAVAWGWKHGTLSESPQDLYDWDFERMIEHI